MAFVPEDYWQIRGLGEASAQEFKIAHTTARFTDKAAAEAAYAHVEGCLLYTSFDAKRCSVAGSSR